MLNRLVEQELGTEFIDKVRQVEIKKVDIVSKEYIYIFTLWNDQKIISSS